MKVFEVQEAVEKKDLPELEALDDPWGDSPVQSVLSSELKLEKRLIEPSQQQGDVRPKISDQCSTVAVGPWRPARLTTAAAASESTFGGAKLAFEPPTQRAGVTPKELAHENMQNAIRAHDAAVKAAVAADKAVASASAVASAAKAAVKTTEEAVKAATKLFQNL